MPLAVPAPTLSTLTVADRAERFPVNRIFCVGRNYAAHAREMGRDPDREAPFFFMKPAQAAVDAAQRVTIPYPPMTKNFHHEVELVVAIGAGGRDIAVASALAYVYGYAIGLDMTRRDLQLEARDKGRPWEFGKAFAQSAPIGAIRRAQELGHVERGAIALSVNGQARQSSDLAKLIWSVAESIAQLSQYETLEPGDLIMTGTPEGVAAVLPGDAMRASIDGLGSIEVAIANPE
ncbi:MAG: fumarylacetoacetate hydrolase family protein [Nevskia sp.]